MPAALEHDRVLFQAQDEDAEITGDAAIEFPEDAFSAARGMVNSLAVSLIIWAVIIYFVMR
jgi:hypothetical protein